MRKESNDDDDIFHSQTIIKVRFLKTLKSYSKNVAEEFAEKHELETN